MTPLTFTRRWLITALSVVLVATVMAPSSVDAQEAGGDITSLAVGGGDVHEFGDAVFMGSLSDVDLDRPVVAMGSRPGGDGYWLVTEDGAVHPFGAAADLGGVDHLDLAAPIVDIATTSTGNGYWLTAADGGIFTFGDAVFHGSTGDLTLVAPVVSIASTPTNGGYWLAAADGGVFAFGDAAFHGSAGSLPLRSAVTTMLSTADGGGYWLFAGDGGVFSFGNAPFHGSAAGHLPAGSQLIGGAVTPTGDGYWLATDTGYVMAYGLATHHGSVGASAGEPVTAIESSGDGYWLATTLGEEAFGPAIPANSGSGRRIVFSNTDQRVWLIDHDGSVVTTYLVSGKRDTPAPGHYNVFSKSRHAFAGHDGITMEYMVRFTYGRRLAIGFHSIPTYGNGQPMQTEEQLGTYRSAGCVRQRLDQAKFLYEWADVGTKVVVLP